MKILNPFVATHDVKTGEISILNGPRLSDRPKDGERALLGQIAPENFAGSRATFYNWI